jgi:hypothetical protein
MIVVQHIEVIWTKASRGAPAATVRNRLPQALPHLPGAGNETYLFRHHRFDESNAFAVTLIEARTADAPPRREGELLIALRPDGALTLGLRHTGITGKPPRRERPQLLTLALGERGRLVVNGRQADYAGQRYRRATYNVVQTDSAPPDLFTAGEPERLVSLETDLF